MSNPKGSGAQAQVARLLTLVPFLHHHEQVRLAEAAELLGTTPEQVLRDLKVLFLCGLPGGLPDDLIDVDLEAIETDDEAPVLDGVIRVSNADYLDRPLRLSPIEASALLVSLRMLRESASPATVALVDDVVGKLQAAADSAVAARQVEVATTAEPIADLAARLERAIADRRQVWLTYHHPARDELTERLVDPHSMAHRDGFIYLDAWCHRAEGPRLFRLDRITDAEVRDTPVTTVAPDREPAQIRAVPDPSTARPVTLRLAPEAIWMIDYYDVSAPRPRPDGSVEVDLQVADPRWLVRLLLRLAPYADVVGPGEFAESFRDAAGRALALYR